MHRSLHTAKREKHRANCHLHDRVRAFCRVENHLAERATTVKGAFSQVRAMNSRAALLAILAGCILLELRSRLAAG